MKNVPITYSTYTRVNLEDSYNGNTLCKTSSCDSASVMHGIEYIIRIQLFNSTRFRNTSPPTPHHTLPHHYHIGMMCSRLTWMNSINVFLKEEETRNTVWL